MTRARSDAVLLSGVTLALALGIAVLSRGLNAYLRRRIALYILSVVNPGWWLTVTSGDCGDTRVVIAGGVLAYGLYVGAMLLVTRLRRAGRSSS